MGLYCSFTPESLGYPDVVETDVLGTHLKVQVDYSQALEDFCSTFLEVSTSLVPVDTGFLQSTLDAQTSGDEAYAEATAEYAQYPEYGTWCQEAQPYFEPAVDAASEAFFAGADQAVDDASKELEDMAEEVMEEFQEEMAAQMEGGNFLASLAMAAAMYVVLFPVLVNVYGIMDSLGMTGNNGGSNVDISASGAGGLIEVEII